MIINGELQTGLGGGICQVSTTVFNAAYEAGLADRRAHEPRALHLALSARARRDRQLPRPSTSSSRTTRSNWLLLRTFVGSGSLTVNPLRHAAEPARRVEPSSRSASSARRR